MHRGFIASVLAALIASATAIAADTPATLALQQANATAQSGLCLYLGAVKEQSLLQLAAGSRLQVQGVVSDREAAARLRAACQGGPDAERISAVWRRTAHLPYEDNLVSMVVAEGWGQGDLKGLPLTELLRVLHPGGLAVVGSDTGLAPADLLAEAGKCRLAKAEALPHKGAWIRIVKQPDPALAPWCNEASQGISVVSDDQTVSPSREVRWVNTPLWGGVWSSYMGNSSGNYSQELFAGGRSFHTEVEWIKPGVDQYELVARNAFNGCVLWRVAVTNLSSVRAADDRCVYMTEGKDLLARSATDGAVVRNYGAVAGRFVLHTRDHLITLGYVPFVVIDKETGQKVWSRNYNYTDFPPVTRDNVMFLPGATVEAVNVPDGKTVWKVSPAELATPGGQVHGLQCKGDTLYVVFHATENSNKLTRLVALDTGNGSVRWSDTRPQHTMQLLPFRDQVWYQTTVKGTNKNDILTFIVLDARTGKEIKTIQPVQTGGACCGATRATDQYVLYARGDFVNRKTFEASPVFGVRSACNIGRIPAYGLIYYGLHTCNCYISLRGVFALSGGSNMPKGEALPALLKGEAAPAAGVPAATNDWTCYRASGTRGNSSGAELPAQLQKLWSVRLGKSPLPQATAAAGQVFAAVAEQHRIVALDPAGGKPRWSFPTEGRVSMAPTYYNGLCLVGDHAGWVYAIDAATGKLVWQLQAAPEQKYMCAFGQIESAWPVKSGVLIFQDKAYFVAGRCGTLDGGIYYYGVEPTTGEVLLKTNFLDNAVMVRTPKGADLLLSDGLAVSGWGGRLATVPNAGKPATPTPGVSQRTLKFGSTWQGPNTILDMLATMNPAGSYMKSIPSDGRGSGETISFDKDRTITAWRELDGRKAKEEGFGHYLVACTQGDKKTPAWVNKEYGQQVKALLLAGERIYCAGVSAFHDPQEKPSLAILSAVDGKELQRFPLDCTPALDGLSALDGKVFLATVDGQILCFGVK